MPISLVTVLRIVIRRVNGNRRLTVAMIVGVVLAIGLMSSTVIYRDALDDLGLKFDLGRTDQSELDLLISTSNHLASSDEYERDQRTIDRRLDPIDHFLTGRTRVLTTATFFLTPPGEAVTEEPDRPRSRFQFLSDLESNITVDEGTFPPREATFSNPPRIDVSLSSEAAAAFGVSIGDEFDLHPFWRADKEPVRVIVTGLISQTDPEADYWRDDPDRFVVNTPAWNTFAFFIDENALFDVLAVYLPDISADLETIAYVNQGSLNSRNAAEAALLLRASMQAIGGEVERTRVQTQLPRVLETFTEKKFFSRLPLLVLTLQVVGIVLYYVVMVSTLVVDRQSGEIALLKSRGAGLYQIVSVYLIEGGVLAAIGMALGPLLALGAIAGLGKTPPFDGLSGGDFLSVRLTAGAYLWGGIGAALSILALVWPAFRASNYSIVRYKQAISRPAEKTVIQRYYLDVVLVIVALILFFQLQDSGSLVTEDLFGGLEQDPLLLIAPAIFIVAVGIIFLRMFPLILSIASWASDKFAGIAVQLSLWHLVRAPLQNARLVLLLILATSIAMFSATFGSTLDQSFEDRASYLTGAPLRVSEVRLARGLGVEPFRETFQNHPGVERIAPVIRSEATYVRALATTFRASLLGVDVESLLLEDVAFFREDFAAVDLATLLEPIAANGVDPPQLRVPAEARRLGMWLRVPQGTQGMLVSARVRDSLGSYQDISFFGLDPRNPAPGGWLFVVAPLEPDALAPDIDFQISPLADGPKDVVSVFMRTFGRSIFSGEVFWDDLQYSTEAGFPEPLIQEGFTDGTVIEPFEDIRRWEVLSGLVRGRVPDEFSISRSDPKVGQASARYAWTQSFGSSGIRGARLVGDQERLAVVASADYLDDAGLFVGDEIELSITGGFIPARIAGSFDLFPTYDPRVDSGLLIVNIDRFLYFGNRNPGGGRNRTPNEAWIVPTANGGLELLRADLEEEIFGRVEVFDASAVRTEQEEDPLVAAGWEGVLFLAFLAVLILSALGFLVSSFLTAQTRSLEFAILRTMGFSTRQILSVVSFEQLFIIFVAMTIGTLVGLRLGVLMMEFLGVTERGEEVIPPFTLAIDWATIGVAYGILLAVFLGTIAVVVLAYARLAVARTLRLGES
ncbi:MAG: FtsX-like permease family protein [Chloroflexi bacterium]|nr:FtsX-like permease family protein [Chloroflexota bacterium]